MTIYGTAGDDSLSGTAGSDTIFAGNGNDTLNGGGGNDRLYGEAGDDVLYGDDGDDQLFLASGVDTVDGGTGNDRLDIVYRNATAGVTIDLTALWSGGTGYVAGGTVINVEGLQYLETSRYNDVVSTGNISTAAMANASGVFLGDGDDSATGGSLADAFYGGNGDDTLNGGGGNDRLYGEAGDDVLYGDDGDDQLFLASGVDTVDGGTGNDRLDIVYRNATAGVTIDLTALWSGGVGHVAGGTVINVEGLQYLETSRYNDVVSTGNVSTAAMANASGVFLGDGNDSATGGSLADAFYGGNGNDTLNGGGGNDRLYGEAGDDTLNGEDGDDYLDGGIGNDVINGDAGNDTIFTQGGTDTIDGGAGTDTLKINYYYGSPTSGVSIDLRALWSGGVGTIGAGTVRNIEALGELSTTNFADTVFTGDFATNTFGAVRVGGGDDVVTGGALANILYGEDGNDSLSGGGGADVLAGGLGNDLLVGDVGDDSLTGGADDDTLSGGDDKDSLYGEAGNDIVNGGDGNDYLDGGNGNDVVNGDGGNDTIFTQGGADTIDGGTGTDTLRINYFYGNPTSGVSIDLRALWSGGVGTIGAGTARNFETLGELATTDFADTIYIGDFATNAISGGVRFGAGDDMVTGGALADRLSGDAGNDTLNGGSGDDYIHGGVGNDAFKGDSGNDTLVGWDGDDALTSGAGNDSIDGGAGNDTAYFAGTRAQYSVFAEIGGTYRVVDQFAGASYQGSDQLRDVENLQFSDGTYNLLATAVPLGTLFYVAGDWAKDFYPAPYLQSPTTTDGDDVVNGTAGSDVIITGLGNDVVNAGDGNDLIASTRYRYSVGAQGAVVTDPDSSSGDGFVVSGDDTLNGGPGDDDIYAGYNTVVDGGSGNDIVHLELSYKWEPWVAHTILGTFNDLGINVNLKAAASGSVTIPIGGLGNLSVTLSNVERFDISFGSGNDVVFSGDGDDNLRGDYGSYWFGNDEIHGGAGNDTIDGTGGLDTLYGDAGNDVLIGGATPGSNNDFAADQLFGGDGDDTLTGNAGDLFNGGKGYDTATILLGTSTFNYTVNLATLPQGATPKDFGDGTRIVGIERIDRIEFGSGIDKITGGTADDLWFGGGGNDVLNGGAGDDNLHGDDGNDSLLGGAGDDLLDGGAGNDTLNGGPGSDTMTGWLGDDTYIVDDSGDVVGENRDRGTDTVKASISYTLGNDVENLVLTGPGIIDGAGNGLANSLTGNAKDNVLSGGAGNDILTGGGGNDTMIGGVGADTLSGGAGNDRYVFDVLESGAVDTVKTFILTGDKLVFAQSAFAALTGTGIGGAGSLDPTQFGLGAAATTSDQLLFYNKATGGLFYDADGSGAGLAIQVATLPHNLALTPMHIEVI